LNYKVKFYFEVIKIYVVKFLNKIPGNSSMLGWATAQILKRPAYLGLFRKKFKMLGMGSCPESNADGNIVGIQHKKKAPISQGLYRGADLNCRPPRRI
jgi:hypothetical protein